MVRTDLGHTINIFEPYLAKVTLSENSQEVKVIQPNFSRNLQRRYALLLRWYLWLWLLLLLLLLLNKRINNLSQLGFKIDLSTYNATNSWRNREWLLL
jgi:hypothetical protein